MYEEKQKDHTHLYEAKHVGNHNIYFPVLFVKNLQTVWDGENVPAVTRIHN